jgi:CdiI N-terminal domain
LFRIRVFTPAAVDLRAWDIGEYERQWREGVTRLVQGAPSTALMTAYRGSGGQPHVMWALWREESHVYVQEHLVVPSEIEEPFDPGRPYAHVGERVPASEHGLGIPEWRMDFTEVIAANLGIRWPL